jgi:hypothetical protein
MAGIGSVVVVLTTGFAGGYFLANPTQNDPPNRLQRVVASAPPPASAAQPTNLPQREVAEAAPSATPAAAPPQPSATLAAASSQPTPPEPTPPQPAAQQAPVSVAPVAAKEPGPDRGTAEQDRQRVADAARSAEKKKIEARKIAGRQRRQREIEYAAAAVKRMLHDRDAREMVENDGPDTAEPEAPRFVLFGQ